MKKLLLGIFLSLPFLVNAQTFSNTSWTLIPNNNTELFIPVTVSGLGTRIDSGFGLGTVCLKITHQYTADLIIKLRSPDGKEILLVDTKGGSGTGYPGTCFQMNGLNGWIQLAPAPFSGSYIPQSSLNQFNDGSDPNGTWNLIVRDVFTPADSGSVHYVNLSFQQHPPADPTQSSGPCSMGNPGGCQCPDGVSTNCDLLPDMTASAQCIQNEHREYPGNITLANATPNIGYGPLEIHGTNSCYCDSVPVTCSTTICPSGNSPKELITQRIYHRDGNNMSFWDRPAGTMSYHASHSHVHVDNWADYSLRRRTPDPDARNWPKIGQGYKMSFCLVNLGDCDSNLGFCRDSANNILRKADIPNSDFGIVSGCGRDQGIYTGNLDIYSSGLNGQGIILPPGTCNGDYYIVSITDPENNMLESNEDNNWVAVPITLTLQSAGTFPSTGFTYNVVINTVNFTANAVNTDSISWNFGDGSAPVSTSQNQYSHLFPGPGEYIITMTAYNQCGPAVTIDTINILPVTTGIQESVSLVTCKLYPNPGKDEFHLEYTLVNPEAVQLEMLDLTGKTHFTQKFHHTQAGKFRWSSSEQPEKFTAGIYFVRLTSGDKQIVLRMVIL